jgi:NAD(P)H-flavin reductase
MYALFEESDRFKKLLFRGGCRTVGEMLYFDEMQQWAQRPDLDLVLTVDQGSPEWTGPVGVVTAILDGLDMECREGIAVICGPPVMMKFATRKVLELGFAESNIFLSMEKNMSCGIGKCGHCRLGTYYCCKDGPVFSYDRIKAFPEIWE